MQRYFIAISVNRDVPKEFNMPPAKVTTEAITWNNFSFINFFFYQRISSSPILPSQGESREYPQGNNVWGRHKMFPLNTSYI